MNTREPSLPLTLSVPLFGRLVFDLSDNSAYAAAERGDIPTILMGRLKRVPVRQALRQIAGGDPELAEAIGKDLLNKLEKLELEKLETAPKKRRARARPEKLETAAA
jgi:hypothetical protein